MYCKKCGQKIPDGSRFCRNCGAELTPLRPMAETNPPDEGTIRVRPAQKTPTPENAFARAQTAPYGTAAKSPRGRSSAGLIATVAVCVLLVAAALAALFFFVISPRSHDEADKTDADGTRYSAREENEDERSVSESAVTAATSAPVTTAAPSPTSDGGDAEKMTDDNCPFDVHAFGYMLRYRLGPGTNYEEGDYYVTGLVRIVEVRSGAGSGSGWGRMENGDGWVSLDYCDYYGPDSSARMDLADCPFQVEIRFSILNVRSGPGTGYSVVSDDCLAKGTYTITEYSSGAGSDVGWGKLSDGGWISLDYCRKVG